MLKETLCPELDCSVSLFDGGGALNDEGRTFLVLNWDEWTNDKINIGVANDKSSEGELFFVVLNAVKGCESKICEAFNPRKIFGIFYSNDDVPQILKGFQFILKGESWVPRQVLQEWLQGAGDTDNNDLVNNGLTKRETAILALVARGYSNEEISKYYSISLNTVKTHLYKIYRKINVTNRINASLWMMNREE